MEHTKAIELLNGITEKRKKVTELERQLARSLTLTELFGDFIWSYDNVTTQVKGNPSNGMAFHIECWDYGTDRWHMKLDLLQVPVILWSKDVVNDVMSTYGQQSPYLRRLKGMVERHRKVND